MRLGVLFAVAGLVLLGGIVAGVFFLFGRGGSGGAAPAAPAGGGVVVGVPASAAADPKELEARHAEVRRPDRSAELVALAVSPDASAEQRRGALEQLSAAKVDAGTLFPLIAEFSNIEEGGFSDVAVEALASLLERGEKVSDEVGATEILVAASRPPASDSARLAAARGLARLKSKAAAAALVGQLYDEERMVRMFAFNALKGIGGDGFAYDYRAGADGQQAALDGWKSWLKTYEPAP